MAWNLSYLQCLANGEVNFDQPKWKRNDFESDIMYDFYMIAKTLNSLTKKEREKLYYSGDLKFDDLRTILKKNDYSEAKVISIKLIELLFQKESAI